MPEWDRKGALPAGWQEMTEDESKALWRRFSKAFAFRASVHKSDWPGINERSPSTTYKLPPLRDIDLQRVWNAFLTIFRDLSGRPGQERLAVLDWEHTSYWLTPKEAGLTWVTHPVPNGDYYLFLEPQFRYGTFGHPWEWTINVFGAPLVERLTGKVAADLGSPIRRQ